MGAPFRRQHPIGPYFADYCCVPLKFVIEIDGPTHERNSDEARDRVLAERGYDVLHFSVQDMDQRFKNVVETIHQHVQLRLLKKSITSKNRGNTSPFQGEVSFCEAKNGWGSLRPTPAEPSDPHPS